MKKQIDEFNVYKAEQDVKKAQKRREREERKLKRQQLREQLKKDGVPESNIAIDEEDEDEDEDNENKGGKTNEQTGLLKKEEGIHG